MDPLSRFSHYFMAVATTGSLRKAAEVLHVSSSAINRQILMAEEKMETPLFERLPSGLRLTSAGELLYSDLHRWKKEYALTRQRFDELQGLKRGHVSVAMVAALSEGVLIQALAEISRQYPHLTFNLHTDESYAINSLVAESEVDIGILLDPLEGQGIEVRAFTEIPIGVVMRPEHPLASQTDVTLSQLVSYRQLLPAAPLMVHERMEGLYHRHHLIPVQNMVCNDLKVMKSLVYQNVGVGILSLLDVYSEVRSGTLAFVPFSHQAVRPLTLALCVAPKRQLSRAAQLVIKHFTQAIDDMHADMGKNATDAP
ncbi:LysR family transcriptional regulator [Pectobacteriaceae bacterium C52]|uniref:LysR family transcriptional regulator n=1 Tax=Serratia sp. (strain ATCC 39006) TaxID=104623 RepID=A0A2I5TH59_SERS3|nr:LysR family transcriptional regulator [Serratia sp. ATCC 39006]AUG99549.1 LysR family transcriptional regulator [Serratia sp. ATCC 39006]AUH03867.1 LysR family transcriptional regulator [Serratia sp. ATCC 39006]WJV61873.1 LysR family transcriptional regulator [Pectobacteriaceae bacterium C52]